MKKSVLIRLLTALGGLTLLALGVCLVAEAFFGLNGTATLGALLSAHTPATVLLTLLTVLLLAVLGVGCVLMLLPARKTKKSGYVMQKAENGVIGISVKSIEGLVRTCVKKHDVIAKADISIVENRNGITILLDVDEAAGLNIPLAVGALQKQIRQYVTSCTGVDVHEVRVMVDNNEELRVDSPYTVHDNVLYPACMAEVRADEPPTPDFELDAPFVFEPDAPIEELELDMPVRPEVFAEAEKPMEHEVIVPHVVPQEPEEDDRPLHQRLFGMEEQPAIVPVPPEMAGQLTAEQPAEEPAEQVAQVDCANEEACAEAPEEEPAVVEADAEDDGDEPEVDWSQQTLLADVQPMDDEDAALEEDETV